MSGWVGDGGQGTLTYYTYVKQSQINVRKFLGPTLHDFLILCSRTGYTTELTDWRVGLHREAENCLTFSLLGRPLGDK